MEHSVYRTASGTLVLVSSCMRPPIEVLLHYGVSSLLCDIDVHDLLAESAPSPWLLHELETVGFVVLGDAEIARLLAVVTTRQERDIEARLRDGDAPNAGTCWAP